MTNRLRNILQESENRSELISDLMDEFERLINQKGEELAEYLIEDFLESLDIVSGRIKSDINNIRKLRLIETAYSKFKSKQGKEIVRKLIQDYKRISAANKNFYSLLSGTGVDIIDIRNLINYRLGLNSKGELLKGGFLQNIIDSAPAKEIIKKELYRSIITGKGYQKTKASIKEIIAGNKDKLGEFEKYHRQVTYDTHVQIDRMENAIYSEKLQLNHFIFQGTRRRDSRHFCIQRKGKAFSFDEAKEFKDLIDQFEYRKGIRKDRVKIPIGPIVGESHQSTAEKKSNYEWKIDLGGYNCVDMVSYITKELYEEIKK